MIRRILIFALLISSTNAFAADKRRDVRPPVAAPFGIVIDKTSCAEAARLLKGSVQKTPNSFVRVVAQDATDYFSGATRLEVTCESAEAPVLALFLELRKDIGRDITFDMVFTGLKAKYDKPSGVLSATDADLTFFASNAEINLSAPNQLRTLTVHYRNKALAEDLRRHQAAIQERLNKQRSEQMGRL